MARKCIPNGPRGDIPDLWTVSCKVRRNLEQSTHSDHLVLSSSGQVLPIRTEADTADVQISIQIDALVLQNA